MYIHTYVVKTCYKYKSFIRIECNLTIDTSARKHIHYIDQIIAFEFHSNFISQKYIYKFCRYKLRNIFL